MKKLLTSGLMPIMTFAFLLTSCQKQINNINAEINVNAAGEVTIENNPTIDVTIKNGIEVSIVPEKWSEYYLDFKANHNYQNVTKYYTVGVEDTKPANVELSWSNSNSSCLY